MKHHSSGTINKDTVVELDEEQVKKCYSVEKLNKYAERYVHDPSIGDVWELRVTGANEA